MGATRRVPGGLIISLCQASDHYRYSPFWVLLPKGAALAQEGIAARISAHMPEWFYVYLAPDRGAQRPAMVLEQGEPHLFIVVK